VTTTYDHAEDVLRYCLDQSPVALVVLTGVTGGTLRARGAVMAVTKTSMAGYISNGCVDADIIARARSGESGSFIYGEGSPYRDITLPCGGRLEIRVFQNPNRERLEAAYVELRGRNKAVLNLEGFSLRLLPRLKLRIAGRGAACLALMELAQNSGFDVHVQSPEEGVLPEYEHLVDPNVPPKLTDDARVAMVCLFHDHDWEGALLKQALAGPAFYIGAMGSQRTHENRCEVLRKMAVPETDISRIKGPIGLIPAQRNARLLAVSILAEIIQTAQTKNLI